MSLNDPDQKDSTSKIYVGTKTRSADEKSAEPGRPGSAETTDPLAALQSNFDLIAQKHPRLAKKEGKSEARSADLKALLEISKAINSTLVLDDILQVVMKRAIELLQAERGFLMLLDERGDLQFRTVYNLQHETMPKDDFKISNSIANEVVRTGKPVFASDAQADERFSKQESILELHLRSIMCVPLKLRDRIIGVVYLDNSSDAKIFLQSDLYLFELFAEQAAIAVENAKLYESLLNLKYYNESVVNATPVGIVVVDGDLSITTLNTAASDILGSGVDPVKYDPAAHKKSFVSLWPERERERWTELIKGVLSSGVQYQDNKYYHQIGDEQKVLSIKLDRLNEGEGTVTGVIVVLEDITEKAVLENYVLMSERLVAKGEMAANIGHELNNYLTIISNNAELLKLHVRREAYDKVEKNVSSIFDNIQKIKRFTDSLMDLSKLEAEFVEYEVKNLIEELLFSLKPHATFDFIDIDVEIPTDLPKVHMDVGQMHQVLLNLIYNAVEAIDPGENKHGRIQVVVDANRAANVVSIEVTDNGPGISVDDLDKVFEPRFTTKEKGHGLGLSNCRRILESHGGTITAISDGVDGTTFKLTMPIKQMHDPGDRD